jgi:hypothetical protein
MNVKFKAPFATVAAIVSGVVFLLTYFIELGTVRQYMLSWVTILTATALLLGLINLLQVNYKRIQNNKNVINSSALFLSLIATFTVTLLFGPESQAGSWIFDNIIMPAEISLLALLSVTLTYASLRLISRRKNIYTGIFIFFFILTLASFAPILGKEIPFLQDKLGPWITQVLASAGARGILIGVALGTIASGLRVLFGADQPFKE